LSEDSVCDTKDNYAANHPIALPREIVHRRPLAQMIVADY
jgi:hypothetical protein